MTNRSSPTGSRFSLFSSFFSSSSRFSCVRYIYIYRRFAPSFPVDPQPAASAGALNPRATPRENFFPRSWSFPGFIGGAGSFYLVTPLFFSFSLWAFFPLSPVRSLRHFVSRPVFPFVPSFLRESDKTLPGPRKSSGFVRAIESSRLIRYRERENPYKTIKFIELC